MIARYRLQNLDCGRIAESLIRHCQNRHPLVETAVSMLMASVSLAKSVGVSREMFLNTANRMLDALEE